jgi:histidinol-phosphate aminotransferase
MIQSLLDRLSPPHVRGLEPYQPGKPVEELERELGSVLPQGGVIKVASNENPLGPSPLAVAAIQAALGQLHLYPDAGGWRLRRALAGRLGVDPAQVILGAGSNELLYQLVLAFCAPDDEVVSHDHAFLSYRLAAQVAGRRFVAAPASATLGCDVDALLGAITPRTKLVLIGTPNNPTGAVLARADADRILAGLPARALLVLDEAYAEYAAAWPQVDHVDGLTLAARDPRVLVLRTFSKIYGLAALRVGYGVGDAGVVELLGRVGRTFNVGTLGQVAAEAALDDHDHVRRSAETGRRGVARLRAEVRGPGVVVHPSLGNFVLIECGRPTSPLYDLLLGRGVIVRPMAAWGLPTCLRVSVATDEQMPRVIAALNEVVAA